MTEKYVERISYNDMLLAAQAIHPDMKLRVTGINKDEWEMFLPTTGIQPFQQLSERFRGTKAWELLNTPCSGFDNALENYRSLKKLHGIPLDGVAEHINLYQEQQEWSGPIHAALHAESGTDFSWDGEVSNDQFSAYRITQSKVCELIDAEWSEKWAALQDKWRY